MKRYNEVKKASILGILTNAILLIIKMIAGIITKSHAMIADATNSASDILASFMTFVGNKIASKPIDDDHNLGHGKAEYIYSLLISLLMLMMSLFVFKDSLLSIINNTSYKFSYFSVIVCLITIIIKFLLFIYTNKIAKRQNNLLIKANSIDHRNDCIITAFNLLTIIFTLNNIYFVDGIVGIGISLWMIITAISIFLESYDVLMDKAISTEIKEEVLKIVKSHNEVIKINHFNSTPVGYKYQISFTIFVDGNLSTFESHKIANDLEKEIDKKIDEIYLTVIHVNPL